MSATLKMKHFILGPSVPDKHFILGPSVPDGAPWVQVAVSRACSLLWCVGFFLRWLFLLHCTGLGAWASAVAARSLSLCGTQALIGPRHVESSWTRIELTSRPLAGGFLSTILPRNPRDTHLYDFLKAVCFSFLICYLGSLRWGSLFFQSDLQHIFLYVCQVLSKEPGM